jgi:hypothetical protein
MLQVPPVQFRSQYQHSEAEGWSTIGRRGLISEKDERKEGNEQILNAYYVSGIFPDTGAQGRGNRVAMITYQKSCRVLLVRG